MIDLSFLDRRPVIVALAGPNGAGKSTFYEAHLGHSGLRFVNADTLAAELGAELYAAAEMAAAIRRRLVETRESFIFETVFSDPVGDKVKFLMDAEKKGFQVVLCYIGLSGPEESEARVAMRVSQGGHDVPPEKLAARSLDNLARAVQALDCVLVYDNSDLGMPFRLIAAYRSGKAAHLAPDPPAWFTPPP